jgi:flagellar biosynthesis GTPase FlhF
VLLPGQLQASPQEALEKGNKALEAGRFEEAKNFFSGGFLDDPNAPELHYSMGLTHLREGQGKKAALYFSRAAEFAEKNGAMGLAARARYNLGLVLAGETGGGGTAPSQAAPKPGKLPILRGGPGGATPGGGLPAGLGGASEDLEGALKAFHKAIELDPRDQDSKYNFLEIRRRLKQKQKQKQKQNPEKDQNPKQQQQKQQQPNQGQDQNKKDQKQQGQNQNQNPQDKKKEKQDPKQDQKKNQDQKQKQKQKQKQDQQQQNQDSQKNQSPSPSSGGKSPPPQEPKKLDRKAMERVLDALEAEEQENLEKFLGHRRAPPRELTHDW